MSALGDETVTMNHYVTTLNISDRIWDAKYRWREDGFCLDNRIEDTWRRIARALAGVGRDFSHESDFYDVLENFAFLPGGRIQAGAGTQHKVTLFNCFVMGEIEDSLSGIFDSLKEGAVTMQQGGGVGYDFSTLRPYGMAAKGVGMIASGPVSFMKIWDSMCGTILSTGARRGAMMGTLRCDHPDVMEFVEAKRDPGSLRHFNLSVLVTDAFMNAVRSDDRWTLVFPEKGKAFGQVKARELWQRIVRAAYDCAEPGVIFIDRVRRMDNLGYGEIIHATNPCGEIPLPPYGACDLGSINLTRFVRDPFSEKAAIDFDGIRRTAAIAVRMLDNVYDLSHFPLPKQRQVARSSRRIGLGITGLADAFIMLGLDYGEAGSIDAADGIMKAVKESAYETSIELAREKGTFPLFGPQYLEGEFVKTLPESIRKGIAEHGIRNSHLTAIAPTGTISLLAGNISSGIEPVYALEYDRNIRLADGRFDSVTVKDYALGLYGKDPLPSGFLTMKDISPEKQLLMQAALQKHVDNAISKTVNVPEHCDFDSFASVYDRAFDLGLKGCTAFRPNPVTGRVLVEKPQCCSVEREAD